MMKSGILRISFILLGFFLLHSFAGAQCKSFAQNACRSNLAPYKHDGNYNATILTEGEEAELYKTFFEGTKYRVAVCSVDQLPKVQFVIYNNDRKVVFDSAQHGYPVTWDFDVNATQQFIINIKVLEVSGPDAEDLIAGCVSVLFGVQMD